jgi:hypothetical protein
MDSPKYNRTPHFPWSLGCTNDDKIADDLSLLIKNEIVITEKMDGSNTSLERGGCFARTHSGPPAHTSFDGLKALHASVKYKIPEGIQLFGEWCYALHSIAYSELPHYFLLFNVRDLAKNIWLSWDEVELWAEEIGVPTVPVIFTGSVDSVANLEKLSDNFMLQPSLCNGLREGIVTRVRSEFSDDLFAKCVMKNVRKNHVNTNNDHWLHQEIVKNKIK